MTRTPDQLLLEVLHQRGLVDPEAIDQFLTCAPEYDPFLLKNMDQVIARIQQAKENNEFIVIYGDFDVDGVTASAVLHYALRRTHIRVAVYIPDRFTEGYGLRENALYMIQRLYPQASLIITVDCGVTAKDEVALAKNLGFDVIITDHHRIHENLPECLVLNPNQPGCPYPNKHLVGVGVAYKLVDALCRAKLCPPIKRCALIDLVALGTIADIGSLIGENRTFARYGLEQLRRAERVGVRALREIIGIDKKTPVLTAQDVGFRIGPVLNAAGRFSHAMRAFDLVTTNDYAHAQTVARELVALNTERKKTQREIMDDVRNTIGSDPDQIILVTGHWPQGITGLLATRLMQTYQRPAIVGAYVHESDQTIVKCSGRAPEHMDISATLDTIRHHFLGSGGHPQACGFSFRAENESTVRTALHTISPVLTGTPPNTTAHADIVLDLSEITQELYTQLLKIGPFGKGNPEPIFESTGYLTDLRLFENVVKLTLAAGGRGRLGVDMVWFFASSEEKAWLTQQPGNMLRIHYTLGLNVWRGRITVQPIVRCAFEETEGTKKGPLKRPPDEH